jgi:beta-lactamase class A
MGLFRKKVEEELEDDELDVEELKRPKRIKDLKPQNRKARKEPVKPWGKKERLTVLITFLFTVITAGVLSASARAWKLPNIPRLKMPNFSEFFLFKEQTVVVGQTGDGTDQEKINKIKSEFREMTKGYSGIYAFYIYDLEGDYFYGENYQEIMQAASLIKLPVMALTYKKSEEGELELEEYKDYLQRMGKRSDNQAYLKMVEVLGRGEIQKYINDLGMSDTSLEENLTTPADIGLFFNKLYKNQIINENNTKEFLEFLTDTAYEDWMSAGIPQSVTVSHKYGREVHCVNDAGIVFADNPYVLVIMTDGVIESEADELLPSLSKLLYDRHIDENTD